MLSNCIITEIAILQQGKKTVGKKRTYSNYHFLFRKDKSMTLLTFLPSTANTDREPTKWERRQDVLRAPIHISCLTIHHFVLMLAHHLVSELIDNFVGKVANLLVCKEVHNGYSNYKYFFHVWASDCGCYHMYSSVLFNFFV